MDGGIIEPSTAEKVVFLLRPESYSEPVETVVPVETHMSWVFLAGEKAYKLKKPLRLAYLDFSTVEKREAACRAEVALNRRLAAETYLSMIPLCMTPQGLALGGAGPVVDWLVVMRKLDRNHMLDAMISVRRVDLNRISALEDVLTRFYRRARPVFTTPAKYLAKWQRLVRANRTVLLNPRLKMPVGTVLRVDRAQQRFLDGFSHLIIRRLQRQKVVDGHGDLRPEHIWLGKPLSIIDCLEFNAEFRAVDPFDELSYLAIECERLGDSETGIRILRKLARNLPDSMPPELMVFYRCYRAALRANLSIAHLLEDAPRTPAKWRPLALRYLEIARREALKLEGLLNRRANRPVACSRAGDALHPRTVRPQGARRFSAAGVHPSPGRWVRRP